MADATATVAQYSFIVTAAVTVFGWYIVARQADHREFRKEIREHIKLCQDRVQKVRDGAAKYWLHANGSTAAPAATELKAELLALSRHVRTLVGAGLPIDSAIVASIRSAATGGEFEKKARRRSSRDIERVVEVTDLSEDLLTAIDVEFYKRFPPYTEPRWRKWIVIGLAFALIGDQNTTS